ncbi:hypothetical protein ILUMI_11106 [Ignelater luminosus]|uniref:Ubiquitin-like domain-containing CTD phosphatase 1 n=1 Tax=Ignelater luminosus TaxID=2038154 RepID=A0A8K0GAU4_IGNLU|nr:hypothetical protein ILUMI_11106 [Ignelater luminosus]
MTSSTKLILNFEDVLFQIDVKEEYTLFDLKYSIYIATGLKPSRQTFPELLLPDNLKENICKLRQLNIKFNEILKVVDKFGELYLVLPLNLKVEWQNILFCVTIEARDTVLDLKCTIYKATGLKPSRQNFANLDLPAHMNEDDYELHQLNLKPQFVLKVIDGSREIAANSLNKLKIEWENIYFPITVEKEDTIWDIRLWIFIATDLEPSSQLFVNLPLPGNIEEDSYLFWQLDLKPGFILKVTNKFKEDPTVACLDSTINWAHLQFQSNLVLDLIKELSEATASTSKLHIEKQPVNNNQIENNEDYKALSEPRPGKKLVVLDIDRTIFDYGSSNMCCATRPFLEIFLKGIYDNFDIGIWSATDMDSVLAKLFAMGMLDNPNYKVLFCLNVNAMIPVTVDKKRYRVKPLQTVWNRYAQYNCHNTIICDDQNINFFFNKKNGILVAPYYCENHGVDNELLRLLSYLKLIGECKDLTIFDHEKWRTHGDWDSDSCSEDEKSNTGCAEERSNCNNDEKNYINNNDNGERK